jgi:hypothetical protein
MTALQLEALDKTAFNDRIRKNDLLRMLHVLDPRYYTRGIPGTTGPITAPAAEKRSSHTRQSRITRDLLRRHFALRFALPRENRVC